MSALISSVDCYRVDYPVRGQFKFFPTGPGRGAHLTSLVVRIAADGAVGWGQCVPSHRWSYETVETVQSTVTHYLAPVLLGADPREIGTLSRQMDSVIAPSFSRGQPICKAAVDLALLDLAGKMNRQSLSDRWGRRDAEEVELSWTLNPTSLEDLEADVAMAHERGYRHFNLKVGPDPQADIETCQRLRELAPDAFLWVDANGGYDLDAALEVAPKLAELGVAALEQPLPANQLSGFARLRKQGALPILMDESIVSVVELREFHLLGLLDGVAMKVTRCGGLTHAVQQVEYLLEHDLLFYGSGLTDPDLALAASLQMFAAYGLDRPAALNGPQFLNASLLKEPLEVRNGRIKAPHGQGLGVAVDESKLQQLQLSWQSK